MSKQLARCPYCDECSISLNDRFEIVFNPDNGDQAPCEHLIWAAGECSQWEPIVYSTSRIIGTTVIHWNHPGLSTIGPCNSFVPYLVMLVQSGPGWEFAPAEPFFIQGICEEGMGLDLRDKEYSVWEADGWAIFARRPWEFLADIVQCRDKQSATCQEDAGHQAEVSLPADPDAENEGYFGNGRGRYAPYFEQSQSEDRWRDDGGRG